MDKLTMFEEMEERYNKRKKAKAKYDSIVNLSAPEPHSTPCVKLSVKSTGQTVRLLDEGAIVDSEGNPYLYVKKGAIEQYYNSLSDDYVGTISLGHFAYAEMPFVLGKWSKADLTVVDTGNGRKALDVNLNLDNESVFVKEIKRQGNPLGVSVNMYHDVDYDASETLGVMVIDDIWIDEFSVVGEAGNVNSGGIELNTKGANMKDTKSFLEQMFTKFGVNKSEKEDEKKELSADSDSTDGGTDNLESAQDTTEPQGTKAETKDTDDKEKPTEEVSEGDTELAEAVEQMAVLLETQEKTAQLLEVLDTKLDALSAENAELKEKLAAKDNTTDSVLSRFKELAVKYGAENTDQTKKTPDIPVWDGVGGI